MVFQVMFGSSETCIPYLKREMRRVGAYMLTLNDYETDTGNRGWMVGAATNASPSENADYDESIEEIHASALEIIRQYMPSAKVVDAQIKTFMNDDDERFPLTTVAVVRAKPKEVASFVKQINPRHGALRKTLGRNS